MPDLPTIGGGPSQAGNVAASSRGVLATANASANTKATTWTELIATTTYATDWLLVMVGNTANATGNVAFLIDIGIGASTAEQTLIGNLYHHSPSTDSLGTRYFLFPIRIPAGVRISARCQSSVGSAVARLAITTISSAIDVPEGLGRIETIGADTSDSNGVSIDAGGTANTDVIGQLSAAIGFAYRWMCVATGNPTDVAIGTSPTNFLFDVVKGAGGSEVSVIEDMGISSGGTDDRASPPVLCFPCSIAAGERVAIRVRCSSATAGDRVLDFVGYGVG